jgi:hypothetical protein
LNSTVPADDLFDVSALPLDLCPFPSQEAWFAETQEGKAEPYKSPKWEAPNQPAIISFFQVSFCLVVGEVVLLSLA